MNNAQTIDLTRSLPPSLRNDERMLALASSIAEQLQIVIRNAGNTIIYANIDNLPENVLDILAYDLHVDWYDYRYSIRTKRAIIKDSVKIHKRLGTVYATKRALSNVYPNSEIEEWFQYENGEPFYFRVIINLTDTNEPADINEIVRKINTYKRLSAHLQEFVYQTCFGVEIEPITTGHKYRAGLTDEYMAGTRPQRNVRGGNATGNAEIEASTDALRFGMDAVGTKPQRSVAGVPIQGAVNVEIGADAFKHTITPAGYEKAGTGPYRATQGAGMQGQVDVKSEGASYGYQIDRAGTQPQRNRIGAQPAEGVDLTGAAEPLGFTVDAAGTKPGINTRGGAESAALDIETEGRNYDFRSEAAGRNPQTNINGAAPDNGGIMPTVTLEQFVYKVTRCGTKKC